MGIGDWRCLSCLSLLLLLLWGAGAGEGEKEEERLEELRGRILRSLVASTGALTIEREM